MSTREGAGEQPGGSKLERRYRRLLVLLPRDHRERHGEEMLAVLLGRRGRADQAD